MCSRHRWGLAFCRNHNEREEWLLQQCSESPFCQFLGNRLFQETRPARVLLACTRTLANQRTRGSRLQSIDALCVLWTFSEWMLQQRGSEVMKLATLVRICDDVTVYTEKLSLLHVSHIYMILSSSQTHTKTPDFLTKASLDFADQPTYLQTCSYKERAWPLTDKWS